MTLPTCDLCDRFKSDTSGALRVLPPVFHDYGGRVAFSADRPSFYARGCWR